MSKRKAVLKRTPKAHIKAQPIEQMPPINHKVDQVVRAIYFGYDGTSNPLSSSPVRGNALGFFDPSSYVVIGVADSRGYRLTAASNSALITMGYHPTAVLLWLTQMRVNGEPVVKVQGDELVALHAAVVQLARDVVFNYERIQMVRGKPKVIGKPILEHYKTVGKPAKFT